VNAFILSGGGTLGSIQVGLLRALFEADIRPEVLVGTSIGAVNAAFLAEVTTISEMSVEVDVRDAPAYETRPAEAR
jgi:NTE family protein